MRISQILKTAHTFLGSHTIIPMVILCLSVSCQPVIPDSTSIPPISLPFSTSQPTLPPAHTPGGTITLRIWLPARFSPSQDSPAGRVLQERLDEFTSRRPDIRLEVRTKAEYEPGGLLDSLTTASAAAHQVLPDLVALPRPMLEAAALKGLLHPLDGMTKIMDDPDWYDYARQLSQVQNSIFGLPFAGDALILVYRTPYVHLPPPDFASTLASPTILTFAASDPSALFPLSIYMAAGGVIQDEQGRPTLQEQPLAQILSFIQQAENNGQMPYWLTQFQSSQEVWQSFIEKPTGMTVTWASSFLQEAPADSKAAYLPTASGEPYTLANGWVWASASPHSDHLTYAMELAEFLCAPEFLSKWNRALGNLPPRPTAFEGWQNGSTRKLLEQISLSGVLMPAADILAIVSPPLSNAIIQVLKQQATPVNAAREAVLSLENP